MENNTDYQSIQNALRIWDTCCLSVWKLISRGIFLRTFTREHSSVWVKMDHWKGGGCGLHQTVLKYGPAVGFCGCDEDSGFQKL